MKRLYGYNRSLLGIVQLFRLVQRLIRALRRSSGKR